MSNDCTPSFPDPYQASAQAHCQNEFIRDAAKYLSSVSAAEQGRFFDLAWNVYQDRWPAPYGRNEVSSYEDFVYLVCHRLDIDGPPKFPKGGSAWIDRYDMEKDRMDRVHEQDLLDKAWGNRPGVKMCFNPVYEEWGPAHQRFSVVQTAGGKMEEEVEKSDDDPEEDIPAENIHEESNIKNDEGVGLEPELGAPHGHESDSDDDIIPVKVKQNRKKIKINCRK